MKTVLKKIVRFLDTPIVLGWILTILFVSMLFMNGCGEATYPSITGQIKQVTTAYLINTAAKATKWTHHRKANDAYYVGARMGEALHRGDYSLELLYQWVKAQAVPEMDVSVSSRDNPRGISMYNRRSGGFANFRGWRLESFYALTENWTLNAHFDRLREMDRHIGGAHRSWEFYFGAIFTF